MEILGRMMVSWVTVVTSSEHLTPRLIQPLQLPVATTSLNLIHCAAQVCFNTDTIFKTSSLRDVSRKSQYLRLLDGQRDTTSFSILSVAQFSAFSLCFSSSFPSLSSSQNLTLLIFHCPNAHSNLESTQPSSFTTQHQLAFSSISVIFSLTQ